MRFSMTRADESAQTLLETLVALALMGTATLGCVRYLRAGWEADRCAYEVFESTRARLSGTLRHDLKLPVRFTLTSESVTGTARCGETTERVTLPRLEAF